MKSLFFLLFLGGLLVSCVDQDSEKVVPYQIQGSFIFKDTENIPKSYSITFAAFKSGNSIPLVYKDFEINNEGELVTAYLEVPENADLVRLYLESADKKLIYSFFDYYLLDLKSDFSIPTQEIDLLSFSRVQAQVFNSCTACHGNASGTPAAGLYLTEGKSWSNLVNVAAHNSSKKRVTPSDTTQSFLVDIMRKRNLTFTHSGSDVLKDEDIKLVKSWIINGAME